MAKKDISSDEDYLDRLLRSVSSDATANDDVDDDLDDDIDDEMDAEFDDENDFDFDSEIDELEGGMNDAKSTSLFDDLLNDSSIDLDNSDSNFLQQVLSSDSSSSLNSDSSMTDFDDMMGDTSDLDVPDSNVNESIPDSNDAVSMFDENIADTVSDLNMSEAGLNMSEAMADSNIDEAMALQSVFGTDEIADDSENAEESQADDKVTKKKGKLKGLFGRKKKNKDNESDGEAGEVLAENLSNEEAFEFDENADFADLINNSEEAIGGESITNDDMNAGVDPNMGVDVNVSVNANMSSDANLSVDSGVNSDAGMDIDAVSSDNATSASDTSWADEEISNALNDLGDDVFEIGGLDKLSDASALNDGMAINDAPVDAAESLDEDLMSSIDDMMNGLSDNSDATDVDEAINTNDNSTPEEDIEGLLNILQGGDDGDDSDIEIESKKKKSKKEGKGFFSFLSFLNIFKLFKKKDKSVEDDENVDSQTVEGGAGTDALGTEGGIEGLDLAGMDLGMDIGMDFGGSSDSNASGDGLEDLFAISDEEPSLDENESLIKQMDDGEFDEEEIIEEAEEDNKKKKKEKKKKEKKPKKPKKKKEKKKKEKKPKKEKGPDEIIPIPKVFLVFALSIVVLVVIFLKFGGSKYYYEEKLKEATSLYIEKNYSSAYAVLNRMDIANEDEDFYNQVQTIMYVEHHYKTGEGLIQLKDYENALDTLIKGVKMYDTYQNVARDLGCYDEMTEVLMLIDEKLTTIYDIGESEARMLSLIDDREEYAFKVRVLAKEARLKFDTEEDQ